MDSACFICQQQNEIYYEFSCGHKFCQRCLFRHIFTNNIKDLSIQGNFKIMCKCRNKGIISVSLPKVQEILNNKILSDRNQNEDTYCYKHITEEYSLYCKTCQRSICRLCLENNAHLRHETEPIDSYRNKIRRFLRELPLKYNNLEAFLKNFEGAVSKFKEDLENDFGSTVKSIDEIVAKLNKVKLDYAKKVKDTLERGILIFKVLKMFYCNFYIDYSKLESTKDVNVLKYLKDINFEFQNLKLEHNKEIIEKIDIIKKQSSELSEFRPTFFNFKFDFKDIPKNYHKFCSLFEHTKSINAVIQLKNQYLATGSSDYTIRFWEPRNGEYLPNKVINEFTGNVIFLMQLKDERLISTARDNKTIKIWDIMSTTNRSQIITTKISCELTLSGHSECVTSVIQLPDEKLISSSRDKSIGIWTPMGKSFQKIQTLVEHSNVVCCLAELPWGNIASGSDDTTIRIWSLNISQYVCKNILGGHTKGVRALCQLKDTRLISGSDDQTIRVWKFESDNYVCTQQLLAHHRGITHLIQIVDDRIVSCSKDGTVRIFAEINNEFTVEEKLKEHTGNVFWVFQLNDGKLASCGADNQIVIWKSGRFYD